MPLSILPNLGTITLFQLDGCLSEEEFKQALEMAANGCKKLYELQRNALMNKYFNNNKNKRLKLSHQIKKLE